MKKPLNKAIALVAAAFMLATGAGVANAAPLTNLTSTDYSVEHAHDRVKVMVTLTGQPNGRGNKSANINSVDSVINTVKSTVNNVTVSRKFGLLIKGFSAFVDQDDIDTIAHIPGVANVQKVQQYYPTMETAKQLSGSSAAAQSYGVDGSGVVVSVIDTGIDIHQQDMRLDEGVKTALKPAPGFTNKVPYGYNFADHNSVVKDSKSEQHGMHVAGIIAANGGKDASIEKNGRINGIAPNAQLLAMKVFSNDVKNKGKSAYGDDIIAAIESSVEHGADIINMSLGSTNGVGGRDVAEERAVANARKAGVEVVVSAGNEGVNGSSATDETEELGMQDDGTVGSPSTAESAWSVASIENSTIANTAGSATNGETTVDFSYMQESGEADGKPHEIVDGGIGKPEELGSNVKGNFVLIERGTLDFATKFKNAIAAGATGVVVFNHEAGGDENVSMAGLDDVKIPGTWIGHSFGQKIKDMIKTGKKTTITFTNSRKLAANPSTLKPSTFTSWGTTPDLNFKPQIAGIGGNVYSTQNDNKYTVMSGTSMAAPHVAGVQALMLQRARQKNSKASDGDDVVYDRIALSNTAQVLTHNDNVPYAPRQIGAGLVNTKAAMDTPVTATVNGEPTIGLKQINGSTTFTVKLTNNSSKKYTYNVTHTCVVNEDHTAGQKVTTSCSNETITPSVKKISIAAGKTAEVSYTLNVNSGNHWVEGWVQFQSTKKNVPQINLPYLGFAGNWNEERIIDQPAYNGQKPFLADSGLNSSYYTAAYTTVAGSQLKLEDGAVAISPNSDGLGDSIFAKLAVLRNASRVDAQILDAQSNVLRTLAGINKARRNTVGDILTYAPGTQMSALSDQPWNGTVYNPQTAQYDTVADGSYTYRIRARLSDDFDWQYTDIPFVVDTVAPQLSVVSQTKNDDGSTTVLVKGTDDRSGIRQVAAQLRGKKAQSVKGVDNGDGTYTLTIPSGADYASISIADNALNITSQGLMIADADLEVDNDALLDGTVYAMSGAKSDAQYPIKDGKLTLTGHVSDTVKSIKIGTVEGTIKNDGTFTISVDVFDGSNNDDLYAYDANGKVLAEKHYSFTYDGKAPQITITAPAAQPASVDKDGKLHVEGKVSDDHAQVNTVTIDGTTEVKVVDGKFTADITPAHGASSVTVTATDGGNIALATILLAGVSPANESNAALTLTSDADVSNQYVFVSSSDKHVKKNADGSYTYMYEGQFNRKPGSFTVNGTEVQLDTHNKFSVPIPLNQGLTKFGIRYTDTDGTEVLNSSIRLAFDTVAPQWQLDTPTIARDGALYITKNSQDITFAGTVWDEGGFGYYFSINGDNVADWVNIDDPTSAGNTQKFSKNITVKNGDKVFLAAQDQMESYFLQQIPVITDVTKPTLSVDGMKSGDTFESGKKITVTVKDEHLNNFKVMLDGKELSAQQTPTVENANASIAYHGDVPHKDADTTARVTSDTTTLTYTLPNTIESGAHVLTAYADDFAGNRTDYSGVFTIDNPPVINAPDRIEVVDNKDLTKQILKQIKVEDDIDDDIKATVDPFTLPARGDTQVTIEAVDSAGHKVVKTVTVIVTYAKRTVKKNSVSFTASQPKDTILAWSRKNKGNTTVYKLVTDGPATTGVWKVPTTKGKTVKSATFDDYVTGTTMDVDATRTKSGISFTASNQGQLTITYASADDATEADSVHGATTGQTSDVQPVTPSVTTGDTDAASPGTASSSSVESSSPSSDSSESSESSADSSSSAESSSSTNSDFSTEESHPGKKKKGVFDSIKSFFAGMWEKVKSIFRP
ncbi:S8 family serine peptidase [Alloscardovia venturai]|uniref:S8 family serine peptidase n=1 Tax=Alloscardovia venturai TaxID=1769421 RepID=A0ABW2Y500_9BIFI